MHGDVQACWTVASLYEKLFPGQTVMQAQLPLIQLTRTAEAEVGGQVNGPMAGAAAHFVVSPQQALGLVGLPMEVEAQQAEKCASLRKTQGKHLCVTQEGVRHSGVANVMDDGSEEHRDEIDGFKAQMQAVLAYDDQQSLDDVGGVRRVMVRVIPAARSPSPHAVKEG
jgi:hypothetical protein